LLNTSVVLATGVHYNYNFSPFKLFDYEHIEYLETYAAHLSIK